MRKRAGRPPRFAAVPNQSIDDAANLDLTALGLLTVLLRHQDGWDITLSDIGARYGYGREALAHAMGLLQVARYVVKIRIMWVNGNQWTTEVYVFDTPAMDAELAAILAGLVKGAKVRHAEVIPPTAAALKYAANRRRKLEAKAEGRSYAAKPRVPEIPHSGATSENDEEPQVGPECRVSRQSGDPAVIKKTVVKNTREKTDAPTARSAADARRASDGSKGRSMGGDAASSKSRHRLTKAEYDAIGAVRGLLPDDLERALPAKTPSNLGAAIVEALALGAPYERTPAQLVEYRVLRRWNGHWAAKFYAGELRSVVGPLVAMLEHQPECGDISCEDRMNIHTGEPCGACGVRSEDRRTARDAVPAQKPVPVSGAPATVPEQRPTTVVNSTEGRSRECANDMCGRPLAADSTSDLCHHCRNDADHI